MSATGPVVICPRCGTPRPPTRPYCGMTAECRWYSTQASAAKRNEWLRSYPYWVEYPSGMPLVLKPETAKTVSAMIMASDTDFDFVWGSLVQLFEELA